MSLENESKWARAARAIKQEAMEHQAEVKELAETLLPLLATVHPMDLRMAAALYSLGLSGAALVLEKAEVKD